VVALYGASYLNQFCRDGHGALATATELGDVAAAQGNRLYAAVGLAMKGWAVAQLGSPAEGAALLAQGIARYRDLGTGLGCSYLYSLLAEVLIGLGDLDEAAVALQRASGTAQQFEEVWWSAETLRLAGALQCGRGEVDGACATFHAAMQLARSYGSRALEARAGVSLVRLLREQGRHEEAEAMRPSFDAGRTPALA
jgi:ATP/maltotriose-dependent transcriptional regulator MalT